MLLDDGTNDPLVRADHGRLVAAAERADIRVSVVQHRRGTDVDRYAALLQTGMFAAVYLSVGLGRSAGVSTARGARPGRLSGLVTEADDELAPAHPGPQPEQRRGDRARSCPTTSADRRRAVAAVREGGGQEVAEQRRPDLAHAPASRPRSPRRGRRTVGGQRGVPR